MSIAALATSVALVVSGLTGVGSVTGATGATGAAALKACERPILTSHQGSLADGDGNTLEAYVGAVRRGAGAIEMDVRRTRDDKFVMFHNPTVGRTTNGTGAIAAKTLAQVQRLRTTRSRLRIPSLGETFQRLKASDVRFEIELKDPQLWPRHSLNRVVGMVRAFHLSGRVVIYSLDVPTLRRLHRTWPGLATAWKSLHKRIDPAVDARFTDGVVLGYNNLTKTKVRALHAHGLVAYSGRLRGAGGWSRAVNSGADTVMAFSLAGYQAWCARQPS